MSDRPERRRLFVPEVVQTSAMDCGPACLAAMAAGLGRTVSYERLREACQTDVDGTSIDTLEDVARRIGLDATQMIVPAEHVLLPEAALLPCMAVTVAPGGSPHFVVVWRRHGRHVQVMDPASGRRWIPVERLLADLYIHTLELEATAWSDWGTTEGFTRPVAARLDALGLPGRELVARAKGGRDIAALDAVTRAAAELAGAIPRSALRPLVDALLAREAETPALGAHYFAEPRAGDLVRIRGAVVLHVPGLIDVPGDEQSAELRAAIAPQRSGVWSRAREVLSGAPVRPSAVAAGAVLAAAGVVMEAALFSQLFELGETLTLPHQRGLAIAAVLALLLALVCLELPLAAAVLRMGRQLEIRLRVAFQQKLLRLPVPYLQTRPVSDMAERAHALHLVRELPTVGERLVRIGAEALFTTAALVWLAPGSWWLAVLLLLVVVGTVPWFLPSMTEHDLRARNHLGALSNIYLDALRGLVPLRAHGAGPALASEHEQLTASWARAARASYRAAVSAEAVQSMLALGVAAAVVLHSLAARPAPGTLVLVAYWALALPAMGWELFALLRTLPQHRNLTLRLMEPLEVAEEPAGAGDADPPPPVPGRSPGAAVVFEGASMRAGGHEVLRDVTVAIGPGEHVAVVGPSGAGKSSLVGLALGWRRVCTGSVRIDGQEVNPASAAGVRRGIAWLAPEVALWNRTLLENLAYGNAPGTDLGNIVVEARLADVLARMPDGLQTMLGERGGLVSGGEGQRVRYGRAALHPAPRLVLLDEPFRGLDHGTRSELLAVVRARFAHATLVFVTHDVTDSLVLPRVLVMEAGAIVEDGDPAVLARDPHSLFAKLLVAEEHARAAWTRGFRHARLADGRLESAP